MSLPRELTARMIVVVLALEYHRATSQVSGKFADSTVY